MAVISTAATKLLCKQYYFRIDKLNNIRRVAPRLFLIPFSDLFQGSHRDKIDKVSIAVQRIRIPINVKCQYF